MGNPEQTQRARMGAVSDEGGKVEGVTLHCHRGSVLVHVGDEFTCWQSGRWRVEAFTGERTYSPSGFAGTPTVKCRSLGNLPAYWTEYVGGDGTVAWCGDSVAASIMTTTNADDGASSASTPGTPGGHPNE